MTDLVRYARRFTITTPNHDPIHGIEFPSGLCLYDQPGTGLEAATSIDNVRSNTTDATVHWADEEPA